MSNICTPCSHWMMNFLDDSRDRGYLSAIQIKNMRMYLDIKLKEGITKMPIA